MNMFKSRRKARDQSDALEALTNGQSLSATYKPPKGLRRKNKNMAEDAKPVFDLSTALPGTDDFRTSLLMPNLSARFSMLREQDDPNTKLGKASDDSVLFPKRASRLNLFSPSGLSDVPENDPAFSTFRPPFADRERSNSVGDGYDSDSGSMMTRPRLGESNTLFGGRQRLCRIPTRPKSPIDASGTLAGRSANEHDTSLSPFQQYKLKEKEARTFSNEDRISVPVTDVTESSETTSPATAFSNNRGTQSSTNSVPKRISTAATSLASESQVYRNSATDSVSGKSNEITVPTPENQSSIAILKLRDDPIPNRFQSPPRTVTKDKSKRPSPVFYPALLRNASSPPVMPVGQGLDFGFNTESRSTSAAGRYQAESPPPNQTTETNDMLANNVQPNDRGKATALGLFNKPAREFDEHQFNQRQIQMHEGNVSSMSTNSRSTSQASNDVQRNRHNSVSIARSPSPVVNDRTSTPQIPHVPSTSESPIPDYNRASKVSGHSTPSRPRSKSSVSTTAISSVKARVESLIRKQNAELAALEAEKLGSAETLEDKENFTSAFFDNDDDESDYDESSGLEGSRATSTKIDESDIHPAFRNSYRVSDTQSRRSNFSNLSKTRSVLSDERNSMRPHVPTIETEFSSPSNGVGLSGLIRTHLRQNSDKSSIFLRPQSTITTTAEPSQRGSISSASKTATNSIRSDPFDFDSNQNQNNQRISQGPPTPNTAMSQVAQQFLSKAMAIREAVDKQKPEASAETPAETESAPDKKSWHEDLEPKHQRGGSSETTKERREFDEDLAERRRKIREGLKSVREHDRSQSPATVTRNQNAFAQQRVVADPQPKAMKMLGLQTRNGQTGLLEDDRGRSMNPRNDGRNRVLENAFSNNQVATFARFGPEPSLERRDSPQSGTPPAYRRGTRDRSNSAVGDRSKSRNRHKEVGPPVPNDLGYFGNWNQTSFSPSEESHSNSDSNASKSSHPDVRSPPSDLMTGFSARPSAKPSPITPHSNSFDAAGELARASPGPQSSGRSTPNNGRTTPTSGFNRKRSVTKTMISEPTFVSSTSSVPLVHLPKAQVQAAFAPPLPQINPRRRGNTMTGEKPVLSPTGPTFPRSTPLETVPASPVISDFNFDVAVRTTNSPSPRKLRKATSEGGSMAAKARQQAMAAELAHEKARSPPVPVFPNRSATMMGVGEDGGMF